MHGKGLVRWIMVVATGVASFATSGSALAGADCYGSVIVQSGETLASIAAMCGTTVEALQAANPGVGSSVHEGQVLNIPGGGAGAPGYSPLPLGSNTYVVQWGEELGDIAARMGIPLEALLAANPQVGYPGAVYAGQVLNLPAMGGTGSSTYGAPSYFGPTYYPGGYNPSLPAPFQLRGLKVTYKYGLIVRGGPGRNFREIAGPYVSAVKNSTWTYIKNSTVIDRQGFVWVQVMLPRMVDGYFTGWIVVKDGLGNYYTRPNIDP